MAEDSYSSSDPYVFDHGVSGDGYTGPKFQYFSPYVTDYEYDGAPGYIQCNVFTLYNTSNGQVVPAYCTDIQIGAYTDNKYKRINLEDSSYASTVAGQLRAIVQNGFYITEIPDESLDDHTIRVNAKLKEIGDAAGVPDLTIGEAISATQTAIWRTAHGSRLEFTDFLRTVYTTKMPSLTKYYALCNEERTNGHVVYTTSAYGKVTVDSESDASINTRIKAVYDYLLSLEPVASSQKVVSPSSFINTAKPDVARNDDGSFNVTVTATVDVHMEDGDCLVLSAVLNDTNFSSVELSDGKQTISLTISNVTEDIAYDDVILAIDGVQTISDVVLYEAMGGRDSSQSMIGADYSRTPVHAQVISDDSRVLNFYKTTLAPNSNGEETRYPLQGITFDIFYVASMDDYLNDNVNLPDVEEYVPTGRADFTIVTNAEGRGSVNLTHHGYPDGVYYIVEREHISIQEPIKPLYLTIPYTNSDGKFEYEVTLQPKNAVNGKINIDKDINDLGNNEDISGVLQKLSWIISTNVPEDIALGKSFVITDVFDNRLDYLGNVKVNIENIDGSEILFELIGEEDYILSVNDVDSLSEGKPSDSIKVELTHVGMSRIAHEINGNDFSDYRLRVHVDSQINANAGMGSEIPNSAVIEYVNSVNFKFEAESDKPVVSTGAANLLKVDAKDNTTYLQGAVFELYRSATLEEIESGFEGLTQIKGVDSQVVKVSFFDNPSLFGEKVFSVTTDENGEAAIYGVAYGRYYLVETKAPNGYNRLGNALELIIDDDSHTYENVVIIENTSGLLLPNTGDIGTTIFTVVGIALMALSVILYVVKKLRSF